MVKRILALYNIFSERKPLLFGLLAVLVLLLAFSASRIKFKEDISAFLPQGHDTDRINYTYQHIGSANKLLVFVSMSDTTALTDEDLIIDAISYFVEQMQETDPNAIYFKKIEYKVDLQQVWAVSQFLLKNMPYFLTASDYIRIDSLFTEEYIRLQMDNNKRMLMSPVGTVMKQIIMADPLHWSAPTLAGLSSFQVSDQFQLYNDFIFSADRKEGIVTIESHYPVSETRQNVEFLKQIDNAIAKTQSHFNQKVNLHYFGAVDIAVTNSERIKRDTLLSVAIAIVLILSILIYVFRSAKKLLLMLFSLLFGWLFALGLLSILKTEVSLIVVGISSIILGIAVNYPLHFMLHHKHEPRIRNVIKDIVTPLTIGNITTVGAFLSLLFISSEAMHDLGLFASLLLVGTIIFVLVFLPHLLKNNANVSTTAKNNEPVLGRFSPWKPKSGKWLVWIFVVMSVIFCIFSFNTKFETDMHKINYMTDAQKSNFSKVLSTIEQGQQTIYYVSEGQNLDEALAAYEASKIKLDSLQIAGVVSKVSGMGVYLPSKTMQQQRLEDWKLFCKNKKELIAKVNKIGVESGFALGAFSLFDTIINTNYQVQEIDYFEPVIFLLAHNYIIDEKEGCQVVTILHTPQKDLDVLAADLNTIDNNSFSFDGNTIIRNMVNALSGDFNTVLFICGFIVFIFLLFTLGRIELSLLAFLPLAIGWFWILGIMNIFDIRFNIVNIILATFIFGQGDDYTIFMTEGLMYEYTYRRKVLDSYKSSIMLSAVIMFVGIGALIIAQHPAMRSLAEVTIIGMGSVVLMTFLLPPFLFRLLTLNRKGEKRTTPITMVNLCSSIYALVSFLIAALFITISGFFLLTIGKKTDKNRLRYHKLLYWAANYVLRNLPRVKTTIENKVGETFEKPAVIICNHQSLMDLMCVMALTPKMIILTNDRIWNNPYYGRLIKYANYYPVSKGIEDVPEKIKEMVMKGYSVMIFPEGTRSEDCSIQRFHRGAFHLAKQLNLDILPIMIHGLGHFLPKKEFMLRKGEIYIKVMNRILLKKNVLYDTHSEQAKKVRKFYVEEYDKLSKQIETPDYYSELVIHNYIYKGPTVERLVRTNLKKHGNYRELIGKLSSYSRVLIMNCGYGELPLLLSLVHKQMEITATDNEQDYLDLAANCNSVPANLHYVSRVNNFDLEKYDSVVLIKPTEKQAKKINKKKSLKYFIN